MQNSHQFFYKRICGAARKPVLVTWKAFYERYCAAVRQCRLSCLYERLKGVRDTQVLGLEAGATGQIRQQFRRLALMVHPDKCTCFGAEAAFKMLKRAAEALSLGTDGAGYPAGTSPGGGADEGGPGAKWWESWDEPAPRPGNPVASEEASKVRLLMCEDLQGFVGFC